MIESREGLVRNNRDKGLVSSRKTLVALCGCTVAECVAVSKFTTSDGSDLHSHVYLILVMSRSLVNRHRPRSANRSSAHACSAFRHSAGASTGMNLSRVSPDSPTPPNISAGSGVEAATPCPVHSIQGMGKSLSLHPVIPIFSIVRNYHSCSWPFPHSRPSTSTVIRALRWRADNHVASHTQALTVGDDASAVEPPPEIARLLADLIRDGAITYEEDDGDEDYVDIDEGQEESDEVEDEEDEDEEADVEMEDGEEDMQGMFGYRVDPRHNDHATTSHSQRHNIVRTPKQEGLDLLFSGEFGRIQHQIRSRNKAGNVAKFLLNRGSHVRPPHKEDFATVSIQVTQSQHLMTGKRRTLYRTRMVQPSLVTMLMHTSGNIHQVRTFVSHVNQVITVLQIHLSIIHACEVCQFLYCLERGLTIISQTSDYMYMTLHPPSPR